MPQYKKKKKGYGYHLRNLNTVASTSLLALRTAKLAQSMLNVEYKVKDNQQNAVAVASGGVGADLINLAQGTSNSTREADSIKVTSVFLNYYISMNGSATDTTVRVLLVQDKQPNGAGSTLAGILEFPSITENIVSPLNLAGKYRFRVLYDKIHRMSINGNRTVGGKKYKKLQMKVRYDGNAGTIADITTNSLALWIMSDEATNTPLIESSVRVRYVDN